MQEQHWAGGSTTTTHRWRKHFDMRGANSSKGIDLFMKEYVLKDNKEKIFLDFRIVYWKLLAII